MTIITVCSIPSQATTHLLLCHELDMRLPMLLVLGKCLKVSGISKRSLSSLLLITALSVFIIIGKLWFKMYANMESSSAIWMFCVPISYIYKRSFDFSCFHENCN